MNILYFLLEFSPQLQSYLFLYCDMYVWVKCMQFTHGVTKYL